MLDHLLLIEQPAQLPVAVAQRHQHDCIGLILRGEGGSRCDRHCAVAQYFMGQRIFDQPLRPVAMNGLLGQFVQQVRAQAQQPVAARRAVGFIQQ